MLFIPIIAIWVVGKFAVGAESGKTSLRQKGAAHVIHRARVGMHDEYCHVGSSKHVPSGSAQRCCWQIGESVPETVIEIGGC